MIAPISAGVNALYTGVGRNTAEVPAVSPVARRNAQAVEGRPASSDARAAEAQNEVKAAAPTAAAAVAEAGKGLLVDLYA